MAWARRIGATLLARLHLWCGQVAVRFGCRGQARRHFERVLALRGDHFGAYVQLGRIAYDLGDYAGWRRELEHARRTDPARFARMPQPFELFEPRLAGTTFDDAGERATWRSLRPNSAGFVQSTTSARSDEQATLRSPAFEAPAFDASATPDTPTADGVSPDDDCTTAAEREHFQTRGPISSAEVRACDLDELMRRLSG